MASEWSMRCPEPGCQVWMSIRLIKGGKSYFAHCRGCGRIQFGPAYLLDRLKHETIICPHDVTLIKCKGGLTSWCPICRVRTFIYPKAQE